MGEFKFACPVCGQHITADTSASGSQLECPTCYRKIVVPQAPTEGQKFILSAAEANKPRPNHLPQASSQFSRAQEKKPVLLFVVGIVLIAGIAAAIFISLKKNPAVKSSSASTG